MLARLDTLCGLVTTPGAPALLRAAVVHGELLALRPFAGPSGVVARARRPADADRPVASTRAG